MKITILQGAFLPIPPVLGGATEKMWYALALDFARRGHQVTYISRTFAGMPEKEWIGGVEHRRVQGYDWPASMLRLKWLDLRYTLRAKAVVPQDADVVVTNTFWAPLLLPAALRKRCMVDVARMPKGQMRLYHQAGLLRANSSPVAAAIKKELPLLQHYRIVTIPNPLPFQHLPEVDLRVKKRQLLYAGRLHPEKGVHLLIKAFHGLGSDWKLKIVGPWDRPAGGGGDEYLAWLKILAADKDIEFTGPIHDMEQLNRHYQQAALFVYPSVAEKGETFGLAPLEAMAWGCVPVISRLACFQDFIEHEQNGLIFDHRHENAVGLLQESIKRLTDDAGLRSQLAQRAMLVRNSHDTSYIASQFLQAFEQMVERQQTDKTVLV